MNKPRFQIPFHLFTFVILLLLSASAMSQPRLTLCYISLNTDQEYIELKAWVNKIQAVTGRNIVEVREFQKDGQSPEQTVKEMIQSQVACNGLVISGHHTGVFAGARASGTLSVDFLERISCEVESSKWFLNVQSLWLEGCRTLGATAELQRPQNEADLANFHGARVGAVREEDHLAQTQWELVNEFASVLDTETPYASRFMKAFSHAKIFGWTEAAPGEKQSSAKSLPFHIHNVARQLMISSGKAANLQNPLDSKISLGAAQAYQEALITLLTPARTSNALKATLQGWKEHGGAVTKGAYGLNVPQLNAHPPLVGSDDLLLLKSRDLECKVRNATSLGAQIEQINQILSEDRIIALSFYTLRDILRNAEYSAEQTKALRSTFAGSSKLISFLNYKLQSKNLGIVRRVEYYSFLKDITGKSNLEILTAIKREAWSLLLKPMGSLTDERNETIREFKSQLLIEMTRSKMLTYDELVDLINKAPDSFVVAKGLSAVLSDSSMMINISNLIPQIESKWPLEGELAKQVIQAIGYSRVWTSDYERIVREIYRKNLLASNGATKGEKWVMFQPLFNNTKAQFNEMTDIFIKYRDEQLTLIASRSSIGRHNNESTNDGARGTIISTALNSASINQTVSEETVKLILSQYKQKGLNAQNIGFISAELLGSLYNQSRSVINVTPNKQYILDFISENIELITQSETNGNFTRTALLNLCAKYVPQYYEKVINIILSQIIASNSDSDKKIILEHIRNVSTLPAEVQVNYMPRELLKIISENPKLVNPEYKPYFSLYSSAAKYR